MAYTLLAFQMVLPKIVSVLRERDHDVSIDLVEMSSGAQREALISRRVDMGFAGQPIELDAFTSLLLCEEPLGVLLPESHPLAKRDSVRLAELANETFILHPRYEYPRYYNREGGQNCMALVTASWGLLLAPADRGHSFLTVGLRHVPLETLVPLRSEVWAVYPAKSDSPHREALRKAIQSAR